MLQTDPSLKNELDKEKTDRYVNKLVRVIVSALRLQAIVYLSSSKFAVLAKRIERPKKTPAPPFNLTISAEDDARFLKEKQRDRNEELLPPPGFPLIELSVVVLRRIRNEIFEMTRLPLTSAITRIEKCVFF